METKNFKRVLVWELPVRFFHWINVLTIIVLTVTGFVIANPPAIMSRMEASDLNMFGLVRFIHFTAAYIFFFNSPSNPLNFLYATMGILVINTVVHFYTVCHLTAITSLKQIDSEFESVSASLKVPFYTTFRRVTLPLCLPSILYISMYLFINALTTVSAVVFLYSSDTSLASVAIMNMDEAGDTAPAAAMAVLLMGTALGVKVLHWLLSWQLLNRTQAWRNSKR